MSRKIGAPCVLLAHFRLANFPAPSLSPRPGLTAYDLVFFHFNLGKDIRKSFGLNSGNIELLGSLTADDVSMEIIEKVWVRLNQP